jgi:hypothetical protein
MQQPLRFKGLIINLAFIKILISSPIESILA